MTSQNNHHLYLFLQQRFLDKCDKDNCINYRDVKFKIIKSRIPVRLIPFILKDMEKLGLSKRLHKFKIKVLNPKQCVKVQNLLNKNDN